MRIAHLSDLHLLAHAGVPFPRILNKRLPGWVNLRLKRGSIHRAAYVTAMAREIAAHRFDHVVVTGDLPNLALEPEFERVRSLLGQTLAMAPADVTVVPGNNDLYTRGALSTRRFEGFLQAWLQSDLPRALGRRVGRAVPRGQAARPGRLHRPVERRAPPPARGRGRAGRAAAARASPECSRTPR